MRIRLLTPNGQYKPGDITDVTYIVGANLCYYGAAEEVKDEPEPKSVDSPPRDKMMSKPKARRKSKRGPDGRYGKDQDA